MNLMHFTPILFNIIPSGARSGTLRIFLASKFSYLFICNPMKLKLQRETTE